MRIKLNIGVEMNNGYYKSKFYENQSSTYLNFLRWYIENNYIEYINLSYIPIEVFRDLYLNHNEFFSDMVKELVLRGGKFQLEKPSYIFPSIDIENSDYIYVTDKTEKDAYKKLDFSLFNLSNLNRSFKIEDNSFYNYIPVDGFKIFGLGKNELNLLKKEFEDKNFKIISEGNEELVDEVNKSTANNFFIFSLFNENKDFKKSLKASKINTYSDIYSIIDNNIFYFLPLSILNNLSINETLDGPIKLLETDDGYRVLESLEEKEVKLICKKLKSILEDKYFLSKTISNIIISNPDTKHISIGHKLQGYGIDYIARIINEMDIQIVDQLTEKALYQIFSSKGVGKVKIKKFTDIILGIIICNINNWENILVVNDPGKKTEKSSGDFLFDENTRFRPYYTKINLKKEQLFDRSEITDELITNFPINIIEKLKVIGNSDLNIKDLLANIDIFKKYLVNEDFNNIYNSNINEILGLGLKYTFAYELIAWIDSIIVLFSERNDSIGYLLKEYEFDSVEDYILINRILERKAQTLKEIGNKFNITRERVRQIEKKVKKKIKDGNLPIYLKIYINFIMGENQAIKLKSGLDLFFEIITLEGLHYDKESNLLIKMDFLEVYEEIKSEFDKLIEDKKIISKESLEKYIEIECDENSLDKVDVLNTLFMYIDKKFYHNDKIVSLNNINTADKIYFVIKTYYANKVLDLSVDSNISIFENIYESLYNENFFNGKKSKQSQIEDKFKRSSEKIIKLGTSKFKLIDIDDFPYELLEKIENYINEELLLYGNVSTKKIYWRFKEEIIRSGNDEESIYYVIKLFYQDDYYFEGRTKKRIYPKGEKPQSTIKILKNLLIMNNGQMKIEEAAQEMGVEEYSINNNLDPNIFYIFDGTVRLIKQDNIKDKTIDFIKSLVEEEKNNNGYVSVKLVYETLLFDMDKQKELIDNDCKNLGEFTNLLKTIYPDINSNKLIIMEDDEHRDYINIFIKELGQQKKYTRKDFYEIGQQFGFSDPSIYSYISNSLDSGNLIQVDENYMIKTENLKVTEKNVEDVGKFLDKFYDEKEKYISLYNQLNKMYLIDDIDGYIPTPEIVSYIACKYLSYKKIESSVVKYDNDPIILTLDKEISYEKILYIKLKDFIGVKTEENILKYLKEEGLINPNTNRLYKSFYTKKLLKLNEFYRIELGKFYEKY